jgi:hypothetical protein
LVSSVPQRLQTPKRSLGLAIPTTARLATL